nr:hypothetical protein [Tanacetum cinerariifolium]
EAEFRFDWFFKTVHISTRRSTRQQRVIVCYNCKGEGHMSKQCTKPRRKRDAEWFKDKADDLDSYDSDCDELNSAKEGRIMFRLVRQDHSHQDKEEHSANKGLSCVITAKAKVTCPSSAQNQGGSVTPSGSG